MGNWMKALGVVLAFFTGLGGPHVVDAQAILKPSAYYKAYVPVRDQSQVERKRGAQRGLQQVLVRMTGSTDILRSTAIQKNVDSALRYAEGFQYRDLDEYPGKLVADSGYQELLLVAFTPSAVKRMISDGQFAFWPENRPEVLVWLVEDVQGHGKEFLNLSSTRALVSDLVVHANALGVPLTFPLLDLDDQLALSPQQAWDFDARALKEASLRYGVNAILVGRYTVTSRQEVWSTWEFFHLEDSSSYDARSASTQEAAASALNPLAGYLAGQYSIAPRGEAVSGDALVVSVSDVANFADYHRMNEYLEQLAVVGSFELNEIRRGQLWMKIRSEGGLKPFLNALTLDHRLSPLPTTSMVPAWQQIPKGSVDNPLRLQWKSTEQ